MCVLLAGTEALAGMKTEWASVRRLKVGTEIVLRAGSTTRMTGLLGRVDEQQITILDLEASGLPAAHWQIVADAYGRRGVESMILDGASVDLATLARTFPRQAVLSIEHPGGPGPGLFGAAAGALFGLMGGFVVGVHFPDDCRCDDPGLNEGLIGAAVGIPAGAVAGYKIATNGRAIVYQAPAPRPARRQGFRFGP